MKEYGLTVLVAAAVTYLLTPLVRRFAIAVGALHAARDRDVHVEPTPLLGGFAIYGGLAAGLLVASRLGHLGTVFQGTRVASGLLAAGGVVVLIGFVDDRWGMSVLTKLAGQVAAGVILVWSGAVVAWLPLPGQGTLSLTSDQQTALTILVVVVTINAVNFIDGLDGLAAGIVGIGAAAFFFFYYTLTKRLGLDSQTDPALASAVLAGVCLGFLPHNFYPARIFMGDTGSMLLGLLLAYAPISSLASLDPRTLTAPGSYGGSTVNRFPEILPLLVPAAILLIPYADLLLAVFRRTRAGLSPFAADKKHLQHRLLAIGHSHRASVMIMYLWAALFAGTVVLLSIMRTKLLVLALVTVAGVLVLLLASMPRLRWWTRRSTPRLAPAVAGAVPRKEPADRPDGRPGTPTGRVPAGSAGSGSSWPGPPVPPAEPSSARRGPSWPGPPVSSAESRSSWPGPPVPAESAPARPASAEPGSSWPGPEPAAPGADGPAEPMPSWHPPAGKRHPDPAADPAPEASRMEAAPARPADPGPPAPGPSGNGHDAGPGRPGPDSAWPGQPAQHPWPAGPDERRPYPPPAGSDGDGEESTLIQRRSR
jgi:UDP-GlcNAc:undecaprenyl-phosphate/decaprenyl-phosphate GlcNAc-1-phosphate transferase